MNFFKRIAAAFRSSEWWRELLTTGSMGGGEAGVSVNTRTAQNYSPVFACVTLAAETISTLPLKIYEQTKDGKKLRADHPTYKMLHDRANPAMTAQTFREIMQRSCELRGIALAQKVRNGYKQVVELWPLNPDKVSEYIADKKTGKLFFKLDDGRILSQDDVFYFYGPGTDGIKPVSRITYAAESLSIGVAAERFGRRFFGQNTHLGGFLRRPDGKKISKEAIDRLKEDINSKYKGLGKSHQLILLEDGMEYQKIGLTNTDSQFLETRRFQVEEVCRWFGMKPHMIGDLSHATYSNIEQQGIEAVQYCWLPRCVRWEQAINLQLLSGNLRAEHNMDGLMRGDLKSQAEAWNTLVQNGILNADEVRDFMGMNRQEDEQGKIYFMPLNMVNKADVASGTLSEPVQDEPRLLEAPKETKSESKSQEKRKLSVSHRRLISDRYRPKLLAMARNIVQKDAAVLREKLAQMNQEEFSGWVAADYINELAPTVRSEAAPIFNAFAMALVPAIQDEVGDSIDERYEAFVDSYLDKFSTRYGAKNRKTLRKLADGEDYREDIEKQLTEWEENLPGQIQQEEITRQRSAFTKAAYVAAGITKLRWVANGKSCPFCSQLDGQIVGIEQNFAEAGSALSAGNDTLTFSSAIGHAPAHRGCDCDIVAEV
jgi:HK97 family phage portal protein